MDQWLVRTTQNWIAGPYTRSQVCDLVKQGKLGLQDEVCAANGYWFYLHEREEVQSQLGIEVPRQRKPHSADEEVTETQTEVLEEASAPEGDEEPLPELADEAFAHTEQTAMINNRSFRRSQGAAISKALQHAARQSQVLYQSRGLPAEKTRLMRGFALGLIIVVSAIVFFALRLLS